jgi:predicted phosphodiesterase
MMIEAQQLGALVVAAAGLAGAIGLAGGGKQPSGTPGNQGPASVTPQPVSASIPKASGSDPSLLMHFGLGVGSVEGKTVKDGTGKVTATIVGKPEETVVGPSKGYRFNGAGDWMVVTKDISASRAGLPKSTFTVSAWVSLNETQEWGSIISCLQDNGNAETGWLLGYNRETFSFGLSTRGADDGDGKMTYLKGTTKIVPGKWYHVAGVYDGAEMRIVVNGKQEATTREQSGEILYPESAAYTIGCYQDKDERFPMAGTLLEVKVHDRAMDATAFVNEAAAGARLVSYEPPVDTTQRFVVKPYLQFGTKTGMTVMWETARPGQGWVEYAEALPFDRKTSAGSLGTMHEVRLEGLKEETQYFYRVNTTAEDGTVFPGETLTLQTAVRDDSPFMFAVIGDTQRNPPVIKTLQDFSFTLRPNMQIHLGDVVDEGPNKKEWTEEMLPSSWTLMSRVAMYPAIGNHEKNHSLYYQYFSLPGPEYWYTYTYGNAQFFSIDTNKPVDEASEQYKWLDAELGKSKATWKFVYHHHPVYSSDENDFGDTYKEKSTFGEPKYRVLAGLYEKHGVDICFAGHIHSYERTWPIRGGKVDHDRGVVYIVAGGGGGGLESAAPSRVWFSKRVQRGHHVAAVAVHGKTLQLQAFDLEGRLFDTMEMTKK